MKWRNRKHIRHAYPTYLGETDLTTVTFEMLKGRSTVSKQFIADLIKSRGIKQIERDIVSTALLNYPEKAKIPVARFAREVKKELLPLERTRSRYEGGSYASLTLPSELRGLVVDYQENIYRSPIRNSAGDIHFSLEDMNTLDYYFGHTRTEDMADSVEALVHIATQGINPNNETIDEWMPYDVPHGSGTRRIIEIQSDLYQKGNLESEYRPYGKRITEKRIVQREAEVLKLKQYNDPTAHFRILREEVKKAAQDGKTTILFPTGETAMQIEGLGNAQAFTLSESGVDGRFQFLKPEELTVGLSVKNADAATQDWIITDVLGDGKFKAVPKNLIADAPNGKEITIKNITTLNAVDSIKEEFDISGKLDTQNPIYRFYEKTVGHYLKSQYNATRYTDTYGIPWWRMKIDSKMASAPVFAFGKNTTLIHTYMEPTNNKSVQTLNDEENLQHNEPSKGDSVSPAQTREQKQTRTAARKDLKELSAGVKAQVADGTFKTMNEALLNSYTDEVNTEFKSDEQWRKEGFQVREGEKGRLLWGKPKDIPGDRNTSDVPDEHARYFPVIRVYSNAQIEAREQSNELQANPAQDLAGIRKTRTAKDKQHDIER